jgi:hypothetical protein
MGVVLEGNEEVSIWSRIKSHVSGWSPQAKRTVMVAGGSLLGGVALGAWIGSKVRTPRLSTPENAPAPPPNPAASTVPNGAILVVTTPKKTGGVLRAAAGQQSAQIAIVPEGSRVTVTSAGTSSGRRWYQVSTPRGAGWMSAEILKGA